MLPVITTDKDIDVVRPLAIPAGVTKEAYVTANRKVHQDCKFARPRFSHVLVCFPEMCRLHGEIALTCSILSTDDPEVYHGMPVNVQVIGRRFQEEKVLAITEYIDSLIKGGEAEGAAHKL